MRRMSAEDGVAGAIVVLVLVVLLGVGTLVLDLGNLYWERRQLQNAADAAALATAQEIVATGTNSGALAVARNFADQNNSRGAYVDAADLEITPTLVRVTTQTGSIDQPGQLASIFAGILGVDEYATSATAAVRLDQNISGGRTIPITICIENYNLWTNDSTTFPSNGGVPHVISFATAPGIQDPTNADCGNPGSTFGQTYPGGFGFLNRDADCMAISTAFGIFDGKPGNNLVDPSSSCSAQDVINLLRDIIDNDREALIPIFRGFQGAGVNGQFEVVGYGGFKLEGFKFLASGGGIDPRYPSSPPIGSNWNSVCGNPRSCLVGYYTRFVALGDVETGGPAEDFGARLIGFVE
jgi:hypothetical protein